MNVISGFHQDLISCSITAANWKEAIQILGSILVSRKYVQEGYIKAVIEREETAATGLPTRPVGVAMPHADSAYVLRTGIAVGVLSEPISFKVMGSPDQTVDVSIIFLIAMSDPKNQVKVLQGLTQIFRQSDVLQNILVAKNQHDVLTLLLSSMNTQE